MAAVRKIPVSDNPFEIKDDEINVEEIMEKIRENIRRRKEAGVYPPDPDPAASQDPAGANTEIARDLAYLSGNWDIQNRSYFISSHRPVAGKFLVRGRELVHGEVRRYVDPVIWKQAEFNRATGRVLEGLRQQVREEASRQIQATIGEVCSRIKERHQKQDSEISGLEEQLRAEITELVEQVKAEIAGEVRKQLKAEVAREVREQVQAALLAMDTDIENRAWLARVLEGRIHENYTSDQPHANLAERESSINYFLFSDEIGNIPPVSFPIFNDAATLFRGCKNVIDIGCGRGSLLRNLQSSNIGCYGIDLDENNVLFCEKYGLNVQLSDAIEHLQNLDEKSLDGVFIGQVLEHMSIDTICNLIKLSYEKMQYGSYIIIVVPNITSVQVSANHFYLDPTHTTHLHPEVIKFILKSSGFREIQEKLYQPVSDDIKLDRIEAADPVEDGISEKVKKIINSNVDKLNSMLFDDRDYCVFAKK